MPVRQDVASQAAREIRALRWGAVLTLLLALFGFVARLQILLDGMARPQSNNIFFRLYALYEKPFLLIVAITAIGLLCALAFRSAAAADTADRWQRLTAPRGRVLVTVTLVVTLGTLLATHLVMHAYPFSMDEFSADFQARIFAQGQYSATLPSTWRPFARGITPIFVAYDPAAASWFSAYLPIYAILKSPFLLLGLGTFLNPLLAGISIIALAGIARQLWPNERMRPWLAVCFLATSSQFIMMSGTQYSMPAHLCFNLLWLWMYLRGDDRSFGWALAIGMLALGLHNPFPHALFVAPFLVRLVRERRWARVGAAAGAYGAASLLWFLLIRVSYSHATGQWQGGLLGLFAVPTAAQLWLHGINLSLLLTWQAPLAGALAIAAMLELNKLESPLQDVAWGLLLTLAFYTLFPSHQGHGWGYRYAYQVIGNLALLAAAGSATLLRALGEIRGRRVLVASFIFAIVIELPLRIRDTESFVRPFAAGAEYVHSRTADVVLIHGDSIWYGRDLLRNDPFLRDGPVVMSATGLTPLGRAMLEREYPGRVVEIPDADLLRLGMTPWTNHSN